MGRRAGAGHDRALDAARRDGVIATRDELLETACARTGLDDFGDPAFLESLDVLVASLRTEARLNELGETVLAEMILGRLGQRLQIEDWYRRHPEIDDEAIEAPLIGLGLPRTGSTALSALLAEDPHARSLLTWQSGSPCPPPSTVEPPDPRIAATEAGYAMQMELMPRMQQLVPTSPTGPMECQELMALDFRAQYFQSFAHIPSYSDYLIDADLTSTYAYERRTLKLLQWGLPDQPWRLKCPSHLLWLEHLAAAFPDARFVMTHRDPTDVMVSVCDVYAEVMRAFNDEVPAHQIGALNVRDWTTGMERLLAFRDAGRDDRFFDLDFRAVQTDPIGEVGRLYAWLGETVTAEFEEGMRRWWSVHAADREANVHPEPGDFGLDLPAISDRFAAYNERVSVWLGA
jgi:hypothetical protein